MKRSIQKVGSKEIIVGLTDLFGNEVLSEELLEQVDCTSRRQPGLTIASAVLHHRIEATEEILVIFKPSNPHNRYGN